ncbi:MAG: hypothetical protein ACON4P_03965 [Candidatus Puniceispirillales bacterium]
MTTPDDATPTTPAAGQPRCLFCGRPEQLIWVHGHGQCAHCGVNAMPCCDGAVCADTPVHQNDD